MFAWIEFPILLLAFFYAPPDIPEKTTHFTWWGICSLMLFDLVCISTSFTHVLYNRMYFISLAVATIIAIGVMGLSWMRCSLLAESVNEMGVGLYILGNCVVRITYTNLTGRVRSA